MRIHKPDQYAKQCTLGQFLLSTDNRRLFIELVSNIGSLGGIRLGKYNKLMWDHNMGLYIWSDLVFYIGKWSVLKLTRDGDVIHYYNNHDATWLWLDIEMPHTKLRTPEYKKVMNYLLGVGR